MTSTPPIYTRDDMNDQIHAWYEAADAYRGKDIERVLELLCPLGRDDATTYAYLVAAVSLGACLVGFHLASDAGQEPGQPNPEGEWIAEAIDPRREGTAVERFCALAVTTAANGEPERVIEQVRVFASPSDRGVQRLADAMMHLLSMFAAFAESDSS